jgi:hypothetical protein
MCECLEFGCLAALTFFYIWVSDTWSDGIKGYCQEHLDNRATHEGMTTEEFVNYMDTGSTRVFDTLEAAQLYQIKMRL